MAQKFYFEHHLPRTDLEAIACDAFAYFAASNLAPHDFEGAIVKITHDGSASDEVVAKVKGVFASWNAAEVKVAAK